MKLFDCHCDTVLRLYAENRTLDDRETAFSLSGCAPYESVCQVFAFWSDDKKCGEDCYADFLCGTAYLKDQLAVFGARLCTDAEALRTDGAFLKALFSVEGAKLLCGDPGRLAVLRKTGVRSLLPLWGGSDDIGGAWDTREGLTSFGKAVVRECEKLGILVDVSHMSERSFYDALENTEKPIFASHSNSRAVCDTPRNLSDAQFRAVCERGGVVGVSLCAKHVSDRYFDRLPNAGEDFVGDVARHVLHYLSLGGEKHVCLGCDFDGTEPTEQLPDVSALVRLYERLLAERVDETTVQNIFCGNAGAFYEQNL